MKLYDWFVRTFKPMTRGENSNGWLFWRIDDIPDLNDRSKTYLRRFILFRTPIGGLYIHEIRMSDHDRCPHNHPWDARILILKGGYWEETFKYGPEQFHERQRCWYGAGSFRFMPSDHTHRVLLREDPCVELLDDGTRIDTWIPRTAWTLVLISGKKRSWGFWTRNGFLLWKQFLAGDREC